MSVCNVTDEVVKDMQDRAEFGLEKYGTTLDRKDLNLRDWLQHAYEEHLDACKYIKRAIMEIDNGKDS